MINLWSSARKIKCGDAGYVAPIDGADAAGAAAADGTIAIDDTKIV